MRTTILMVAGIAAVTACSGAKSTQEVYTPSGPITVPSHGVVAVQVNPTHAALIPGGKTRLTATPKDGSGSVVTDVQLSWKSSDTRVATVSDSGDVVAVALGNANI